MAKANKHSQANHTTLNQISEDSLPIFDSPSGWKLVADTLPQLVWILNADGSPEYYNQRWYEFAGVSSFEELSGLMDAIIYEADRLRVSQAWQRSLTSGEPVDVTFRMINPITKEWRWFLGRGIPMKDADGHIIRWLGTSTDIHQQKLAQEHQQYLSEASEVLSSSLDMEKTLKSVAKILVPEMADWFGVDLAKPDGTWESVLVSHVDPKKVEWVKSLQKQFHPDPNAPTGTAAVLRTGKTEYYPYISPEMIEALVKTDEERKIVNKIGFTSLISAPMNSRNRIIGVLSVVSAESGRRYAEEDVRLIEELADRVGMAIDNARLFQQRQEELKLRKEIEEQLRDLNRTLEERVMYRTAALETTNRELVREIEERHKAEYALKRQATLLNLAHEAIFTRDWQSGRLNYWNEGAARLYGYSKSDALGKSVGRLLKSVYPIPFEKIEQQLLKTNYWEGEITHTTKDGQRLTIYSHWTLHRDKNDKPAEILEINIDVTRQKQSEIELMASQQRFATAVTSMQEGVILQDGSGTIQLTNQAAANILGLSLSEIMGRHIDDLPIKIVDENGLDLDLQNRPSAVALETGMTQYGKTLGIRKADMTSWVSVNATPLISPPQKKPNGVLITYTDITERRKLEEERLTYAKELERSNRELQDFASVASHDLQEPLRKIRAFSDRLVSRFSNQLDQEGVDYLERVQLAAERMQLLINDLLTYSRITTRAQPFKRVSLKKITAEVLGDLEASIEQQSGNVKVGSMIELDADPTQMRQLLQNLIANGLKFHQPEKPPVVKVSAKVLPATKSRAKQCCITVEDNGIGMDPKYYDRIFQMFQRLHGRDDYSGTGVGLAVARKIVDRHHGTIEVESLPDHGSTFRIYLPITQQDGGTV